MRGKNIQKIMSVSLSAIVVLGLCACGDSGYTSDTGYYYQDKDADLDAVTPPEDETAESVGAEAPADEMAAEDSGAGEYDPGFGAVTGKAGAGSTNASANSNSTDTSKDTNSGKLSQDEQKKIADDLTTVENAYATEFDWLIDKVFNISKGEWANETDPEYCRRIEGDEAALLNGGWKCFIFEGDPGYYTGQYERYLNAVVDTDGNKFNITLNWNLWYADNETIEEQGQEILSGKWDSSKATAHTESSLGNVDFTDFYITHDNLGEYAVGTLQWNSGEVDHIGLMRGTPMNPGSAVTPSSTAGLSDQETLLIERAKKLSGAPEAELEKNMDGTVTIHLFETVDDGDGQSHTATWDWYTVDPKTMKGTNFMEEEIDLGK